jgi:hypothetical protein
MAPTGGLFRVLSMFDGSFPEADDLGDPESELCVPSISGSLSRKKSNPKSSFFALNHRHPEVNHNHNDNHWHHHSNSHLTGFPANPYAPPADPPVPKKGGPGIMMDKLIFPGDSCRSAESEQDCWKKCGGGGPPGVGSMSNEGREGSYTYYRYADTIGSMYNEKKKESDSNCCCKLGEYPAKKHRNGANYGCHNPSSSGAVSGPTHTKTFQESMKDRLIGEVRPGTKSTMYLHLPVPPKIIPWIPIVPQLPFTCMAECGLNPYCASWSYRLAPAAGMISDFSYKFPEYLLQVPMRMGDCVMKDKGTEDVEMFSASHKGVRGDLGFVGWQYFIE